MSLGQEETVFAEFSAAYTESANKLLAEWGAEEPTEPGFSPVKERSLWARFLAVFGLSCFALGCSGVDGLSSFDPGYLPVEPHVDAGNLPCVTATALEAGETEVDAGSAEDAGTDSAEVGTPFIDTGTASAVSCIDTVNSDSGETVGFSVPCGDPASPWVATWPGGQCDATHNYACPSGAVCTITGPGLSVMGHCP